MTNEETTPLDISCAYAARQISQYHRVIPPTKPRWMRKYHGYTEHEDKQFNSVGLETRAERDSWIFLQSTGNNLARMVHEFTEHTRHAEVYRDNFEVLFLHTSIEEALAYLEARYWIPVDGFQKPEIVDHRYPDEVMNWLCHSIYDRRDQRFNLLDSVDILLHERGVQMRPAKRATLDIHIHNF